MTTQHVDALFPRHTGTWTESSNLHWWTTSGGSTFLPSGSEEPTTSTDATITSSAYTSDPSGTSTGAGGAGGSGAVDKKGSYVGIHSTGFRDFLLKPELLRAIGDCGFEHPSEGQSLS